MPTNTVEFPSVKSEVVITQFKGLLDDNKVKIKCKCLFCGKQVFTLNTKKILHNTIVGNNDYYCSFCIKHNLYHKSSKDTLVLSFRGIIGFYYYCLYRISSPSMYLSELEEHVALHEKIGNNNPVFLYDKDSYYWFLDFNKIGNKNKQIRLKHVSATILEMLASFNLYKYYPEIKGYDLYLKYQDAILDFWHKRSRPADKKVLTPTLFKCNIDFKTDAKVILEDTRSFIPEHMIPLEKLK